MRTQYCALFLQTIKNGAKCKNFHNFFKKIAKNVYFNKKMIIIILLIKEDIK